MKITMTEDMITLVHMIESSRRTLNQATDRHEPQDVLKACAFVLREEQAELADLIAEAYRHEVRV